MIGAITAGLLGGQYVAPTPPTPPISGYKLWLDAADTATITKSGSAVSSVSNKGSLGNAFTQSTTAYKPASGLNTQNGNNILDWNANACLTYTGTNSSLAFTANNTGQTIFVAFKISSVDTNWLFGNDDGTRASIGFHLYGTNTSNVNHEVQRNVSGSAAISNVSTTNNIGVGFTYVTVIQDPAQSTAANRSDIRVKQGSAIKNNTLTNAVNGGDPTGAFNVGDYIPGGGIGLQGAIGEILIYQGILSSGDILSTQQYLASKWGV